MSNQDEKTLYEQQENRILAQSDAFINLFTKRGILGDILRRWHFPWAHLKQHRRYSRAGAAWSVRRCYCSS